MAVTEPTPWTYLPQPPDHAAARIAQMLSANGIVVTAMSETAVLGTHTIEKRPDFLTAVVLWLLCIIPGVVYMVTARKTIVTPIAYTIVPTGDGSSVLPGGPWEAQLLTGLA